MATRSKRDDFEKSGPRHLDKPDWLNPTHIRSIMASLVNAVYVHERDRQGKRQSPTDALALAPPWWTFFNFHPSEILVDKKDHSIFAAVFENHDKSAPAAVVAFRGTILKRDTFTRDLQLNLKVIADGLHETSRFKQGVAAVRSTIARHGHTNVWLAGHSLGAAVAMAVGRKIKQEDGSGLECHLFNPPFLSAPLELIRLKKLMFVTRSVKTLCKATLAFLSKDDNDPFHGLYEWIPNLYVNSCDYICSEYVGYFENREWMKNLGLGKIAEIAARYHIISASHLIPSARLTINRNPSSQDEEDRCLIRHQWSKFRKAHGIHQWWSQEELQLKCTLFTRGDPPRLE